MTPTEQQRDARKQAFGYTCRACSRCCAHKVIQVNPYEIARLARGMAMSTADFRARYTERGGAILKRNDDDVCVFLTDKGCGVHPDRPLVCRLYPLGRRVTPDNVEIWLRATPHPQSEGTFSEDGTIADFIEAQGALPYMRAADDYADWVRKASAVVDAQTVDTGGDADELLDMDGAISAWCKNTGTAEPADIEQRRLLHLTILYRQIEPVEGGKT
ncbi:MAG TPA: YkgJ family cysteine cluster protein [Rhizomicrobium sp.]|nr:YkgJ family cysteine cluster protein [Rhizomicrobium sp.]